MVKNLSNKMIFLNLFVYLILFLLVLVLAVFIPGAVLLSWVKSKFSFSERLVLSFSVGLVIFTLLGFFLSLLGLRFLILPVELVFVFYFFKKKIYQEFKRPGKIEKWPVLAVVIGGLTQALLMLKSGLPFKGGLAFWGVHGYDGIWHTSLIAELARAFPPQNPGFVGHLLKNYHFLTDLFIAQIHLFSQIPILDLYFRFCPLFFVFLLNSLIYIFALRWSGKKTVAFLSIFFVSIAGSFGWILPFLGFGSNNWETAFWGIQTPSSFVNPPFGISLIIILSGLIILDFYQRKKERILAFLLIASFGSLIGFKVYGALIFLLALELVGVWEIIRRKDFSFFTVYFASGLVSLGIFFPFSRASTGFLIWQPWWFIRTMIQAPDRVNWQTLELKRQVYSSHYDFFNLFVVEGIAFLIFLFGNLSARALGFLALPERVKKSGLLDKILFLVLPLAFLPPIFFIQKAVPWNAIQFLYYFTFVFSFFAALATDKLLAFFKPKFLKAVFLLILIGVSLPSTIETIHWFTAPTPTTLLEVGEVEALAFLKENSQKDDIILTYPHGEVTIRNFPEPPVPMTYYNSPYVSFFADRRVFLEDQNAATILDYPVEERLRKVRHFFQTEEVDEAKQFLVQEKIAYIYLVEFQEIVADQEALGLEKIFDNQKVRIFQVNGKI